MIEHVIICVLILVMCAQQVYWSWMTQKLVNKIMSGNYGSYVQAQTMEKRVRRDERGQPLGKGFQVNLPTEEEQSGMRELEILNSMIPR